MSVRGWLVAAAIVAVGVTVYAVLGLDETPVPTGPDGDGDPTPIRSIGNGEASVSPGPSPGQRVVHLLTAGTAAEKDLAELARTADGVRALLEGLELASSDAERARLQLHLLLGGTAAGRDAVFANARGEGRPRDRMAAVLALAGGDAAAVAVLEGLLAAPEEKDVFAQAVHALALRGDAKALFALAQLLSRTGDGETRALVYVSLTSAPVGHAPREDFFSLLAGSGRAPGLLGADPSEGAYRGLVDRISSETDPETMHRATQVLVFLPGREARDGILGLWRRSEGTHRQRMTERVVQSLEPERAGTVACLVGIVREMKEEAAPMVREQVMEKVRRCNHRDALPALREWSSAETEPGIREQIEREIARIEKEGEQRQPRIR